MLHRITNRSPAFALVALFAVAACDDDPAGVTCTSIAVPALTVSVLDSASGAAASAGATIIARGGTTGDSVTVPAAAGNPVPVAFQQSGTFTLAVRQTGYQPWSKSGIVVTADQCHPHTVSVSARLQR